MNKKIVLSILVAVLMASSGMIVLFNASNSPNQLPAQPAFSHSNKISPPKSSSLTDVSKSANSSPTVNSKLKQAIEKQVLNNVKAEGLPLHDVYLPDFMSQSTTVDNHVTLGYISSPAPMGIADYGLMNQSGSIVTYNYTTPSFMASVTINNFSDLNVINGEPQSVSIQLNAILNNVALFGNSSYNFWTQNVIFFSPRTSTVSFIDNVWNFSNPQTTMTVNAINYSSAQANGLGQTTTQLHFGCSLPFSVKMPFTVNVYLNTSLEQGRTTVWYNYSIPQDNVAGTYDEVIFNSTYGQSSSYSAPTPHYFVSGSRVEEPVGLPYDAEISMGGPGGGSNAMISKINATEHLMYMNPNGHYNPVKAAYDAGSQTGETSVGVDVSYSGTTAYLNSGPSLVYGLWNNTHSQTNYKVNFEQPAISEASISFTGNVASDFAGHLLYHQTGTTGYGSSNNITNFYVSYNATDLFIGLQEVVSGNSIVIYMFNNSNSGYGATNMTDYSGWGIGDQVLSMPVNEVFTAYYNSSGVVTSGKSKLCEINSLDTASTSAISSAPLSYTLNTNATNDTTEIAIPLSEIMPAYMSGVPDMSFAAFIIGGTSSGSLNTYVGTGVPYKQVNIYPSNTYPFNIVNYVNTLEPLSSTPFLFVQSNTTLANLLQYGWSPSSSFTLPTANYQFQALMNNYNNVSGIITGPAKTIVMVSNQSMGIYTPILLDGNAAVASASVEGNGSSDNPYIIIAYSSGLNPIFGQFNDFTFPVFFGVSLANTNVSTEIIGYNMLYAYAGYWLLDINFLNEVYGANLFTFNSLPMEVYNSSNVTIFEGTFETWSSFLTFSGYSLYLWNSTNIMVTENEFKVLGIGMFVYNPLNQNANITVFSNYFEGLNYLCFYSEKFSISQMFAFDSSFDSGVAQIGLYMSSGGNTIYHNYFLTQTPVCSPEISYYTGKAAAYSDSWNNATTGNAYWNFNGSVPFNESGDIASGSDHHPNSFVSGDNITFTTGMSDPPLNISIGGLVAASNRNITLDNTFIQNDTTYEYYAVYTKNGEQVSGHASLTTPKALGNVSVNLSKVLLTNTLVFSESGLASGTTWSVNVSGQTYTSTSSSITIQLPDGVYYYNISQVSGFTVIPESGSINLTQYALVNVQYLENYTLTFKETGLPSGTNWTVDLNNVNYTSSTSKLITVTNGSYSYMVTTALGFTAVTNASGTLTINGSSMTVNVLFNETFKTTFTETGLPSGAVWYVNITGMASSGPVNKTSYSVYLLNGTFSYAIATPDKIYEPSPITSSVKVNATSQTVNIKFTELTYKVTFTETGLPSGTEWFVNLSNGKSFNSTTSTITFYEPNGSYSYTLGSSNFNYGNSSSLSFTVKGASVSVNVNIPLLTYTVTLTEKGLPSGATWYVNVTGPMNVTLKTTAGSANLTGLPNGQYSYTVASAGYTSRSGNFTVHGNDLSLSVTLSKAPVVTKINYDLVYGLIAVIIATVIVAAVVLVMMSRKK